MTTITKERLLTIKQWRETYGSDSNVVLPAEEAEELARIALASLEAKPIGAFHIAEQQVDGTSDYLKDGEWPIDNGIIEVYAAPPVPVVPEEKPMPNPLSMYAVDAVAAIAEVRGWNSCRAAMLHGAEPVSQTYKLPPLSSSEVNDAAWKLHNMLTEHVPLNGRQFNNLKGCFYEALKVAMRNYPVTPDGWISCSDRMPDKLIPVIVMYEDGEMWSAMWNGNRWDDGTEYPDPYSVTHWREMPAAPQQEVNRG
ncbi:TPA: DUF551 domain-containing protein [Escherichia coli]|uniref:DUF551 domain-containing protein n=1 Tax=Escherichia coli TaxID=562 RepID=UPI000BE54676|nr:DUF551 domain-containing protein [Escherichia coli]EFH5751361.1 DUF551 domain-containing protein [Escherichia coli]MBB8641239.1 DUF551 domain-containing protein [Escherichia coli]MCF3208896.1 DUF551 domain-containing protein [Escherichia coli]MCX1998548.1 DUF551 domain-containing protein [Escherichia coli]GDM66343.1 putative phage protein [Escherichia coli]